MTCAVRPATILAELIDWAEVQFRAMGRDDARELAVALIAAYEGIALLAAALRDPGLISVEADRLERWIDSLAETSAEHPGDPNRMRKTPLLLGHWCGGQRAWGQPPSV